MLNIDHDKFNNVFVYCNGKILRERGSSIYICNFIRSRMGKTYSSKEAKQDFKKRLIALNKLYGDTKFKLKDYVAYYMYGDINVNNMLGVTFLNGIIFYIR